MSFTDHTSNIFNVIETMHIQPWNVEESKTARTSFDHTGPQQAAFTLFTSVQRAKISAPFLQSRPPLDHPKA